MDFRVTANNVKKSKAARDTAALDYLSSSLSLETELQTVLIGAIGQAGSVLFKDRQGVCESSLRAAGGVCRIGWQKR
jgi:hypothetical protein